MKPVWIAGGGLAGGAAATALARAGRDVVLIERDMVPTHKMCGEFLSVEAQGSLRALGFDVEALGGHPIRRLRLVRDDAAITVDLPFLGIGITRRRLDAALLDHAESCGATIHRGVSLRGVTCRDDITLDLFGQGGGDRRTVVAETLLLATGKHDIRGLRRDTGEPDALVGFKMYFRLNPASRAALAGHIDLVLFADGYAGLQLVEDGIANLCLLVERKRLQRAGGQWAGLLADLLAHNRLLADRLAGAEALLEQPLSIFRVPYGFVYRPGEGDSERVFRLGDQAGVIPSFTGDGMAIALHSARRATDALGRGWTAQAYHGALRRDITGQIRRAGLMYRLARNASAQRALFRTASWVPSLLQLAATYTRVPATRLTESGLGEGRFDRQWISEG